MNSSGILNYMSEKSHNSLYKNGKVFTKRDINGSDAGSKGIDLNKQNIKIINARDTSQNNKISIDKQGFEILHSNISNLDLDFFNNKEVLDKYYSYCANFIKDRTGAKEVYAFDHIDKAQNYLEGLRDQNEALRDIGKYWRATAINLLQECCDLNRCIKELEDE